MILAWRLFGPPAYSPEFNLAELVFNKLKKIAKIEDVRELFDINMHDVIFECLGKGELILRKAQAERSIGFPLPNKSDIGRAVGQTTVLLLPPENV